MTELNEIQSPNDKLQMNVKCQNLKSPRYVVDKFTVVYGLWLVVSGL